MGHSKGNKMSGCKVIIIHQLNIKGDSLNLYIRK